MNERARQRLRITVRGAVQGVGFRPFVYRLATAMSLAGWVTNSSQGVTIEVEGTRSALDNFLSRLTNERPSHAIIQSCESALLDPVGLQQFEIRESADSGGKSALILPDIAPCADCLREMFDRSNRRFHYPFTNCTNCGPRFSIIEALPYDRASTSMRKFAMCTECAHEYGWPHDRRFHAEPTACPRCGPRLQFWNSLGKTLAENGAALQQAAAELRSGNIVALKGVGGFQLLVDARNDAAVVRLRARKHREEKPFALTFVRLREIRASCEVSELEEQLLHSPAAPIVLLRRRAEETSISPGVAPGNPNLGVMLPSSPLHHLLLRELDFPLVATSGNLSDEPICIDECEALDRLHGIADSFLIHDRPIVRHVDDSIVRVIAGRPMLLRRARGFAPLPITLPDSGPTVLALGAHLKNTVALRIERDIFVSQHIGDLATREAHEAFARSAADLPRLYDVTPALVAHDLHPDYLSTKHALEMGPPRVAVQHHWAHIAACMAENEIAPPLLGVAWDGTGFGSDGTIWGGEFFLVEKAFVRRVAHFRTFPLPGGEAAVQEPRRTALGLLHEIFGDDLWLQKDLLRDFSAAELKTLRRMLEKNFRAPLTSSAGRLFDAIAALAGLRTRSTFEGQAAMELEFAADREETKSYPLPLGETSPLIVDWEPAVRALLQDRRREVEVSLIAARFHNFLVEAILAVARHVGVGKVVLSGGCFQNRYLLEKTIALLQAESFSPYWHQRIPPNDGGISLGQAWLATSPLREIS